MTRKLPLLAFALFFATAAFGQALTPADREKGVAYLEQTRDAVVAATKGLSDAQLKFKPAPDRWSVAEVLEHITLVEDALFQNTSEKVMKAPAGPADRDVATTDAFIVAAIPDRTHKAQAPSEFVPTGRWTPAETLDHFLKSRARTIAFLQSTPDLRDHVTDSPLGKQLDAYEWLLFMSAHSERHTKQILEVKSNPNFPRQ